MTLNKSTFHNPDFSTTGIPKVEYKGNLALMKELIEHVTGGNFDENDLLSKLKNAQVRKNYTQLCKNVGLTENGNDICNSKTIKGLLKTIDESYSDNEEHRLGWINLDYYVNSEFEALSPRDTAIKVGEILDEKNKN